MVIGQYKILEKIGEGGMGVVYKAEHETLEQLVALKALPSALSSNTEMRKRFVSEAKIQAKLSHPNVVNLLNFFEHDDSLYLVMEFVEGETVESMIKRNGPIPLDKCKSIFKQVLDGIGYAHSKGIIHRDIKPGNLMVNKDGTVKITDFGIAKIAGDFQKTRTDIKIGTLFYMSPEQVKGQPASISSDIYSLGITLYEMVTGKVPFSGNSEYHIMKSIVESTPPSPREFEPHIPVHIEKAILNAVAKLQSERFKTAKDFSEALLNEEFFNGAMNIISGHTVMSVSFWADKAGHVINKIKLLDRRVLWITGSVLVLISTVLIYFGVSDNTHDKGNLSSFSPRPSVVPVPTSLNSTPPSVKGQPAGKPDNVSKQMTDESSTLAKAIKVKEPVTPGKTGNDALNDKQYNKEKKDEKLIEDKVQKEITAGSLYLDSTPSKAEIFINGRYMGITPKLIEKLQPGKTDIIVGRIDGYMDYTDTVEIKPDEVLKLNWQLSRTVDARTATERLPSENSGFEGSTQKMGSLFIVTEPVGARIYIDGTYRETSPAHVSLPSGEHMIVLIKENYQAHTAKLTVNEGTKPFNIRLIPK